MRARDRAGNVDQTPARRDFTVVVEEETARATEAVAPVLPPVILTRDAEPPALRLGGKRKVRARRTITVIVRATEERVHVSVSGKVAIRGRRAAYRLKGVKGRFIERGRRATSS